MKFEDLVTGNVVDSDNEIVIEQYKKHSDRYKPVKIKVEKTTKKAEKE